MKRLTLKEKQEIESMTPEQAFEVWKKANMPENMMGRLFDRFGGSDSKLYQDWVKEQTKQP